MGWLDLVCMIHLIVLCKKLCTLLEISFHKYAQEMQDERLSGSVYRCHAIKRDDFMITLYMWKRQKRHKQPIAAFCRNTEPKRIIYRKK